MMPLEQPIPSRVVARILGSRSSQLLEEYTRLKQPDAIYEAFSLTPGVPRMGFTLGVYLRQPEGVRVQSHGILFHDVKKPKWKSHGSVDYVTFSHAGEAYTLRGRGLFELYLGLMDCSLQSALEYEETVFAPLDSGAPVIDRVAVADVAEMARRRREARTERDAPEADD